MTVYQREAQRHDERREDEKSITDNAGRVYEPADGEAAEPLAAKFCDSCGAEIDFGWICARCERSDLDPAERMFGGIARG